MRPAEQPFARTWKYAALRGGEVGAVLTAAYVLLFVLYASIRSAATILQAGNVDAGVVPTILATAASLLWAALVAGALFSIFAIVLGALSGVLVFLLLGTVNPQHSAQRAFLVGFGTTVLFALLLYVGLGQVISMALTLGTAEAMLFWFGLPVLIYVLAGGVGAWMLNRETKFSRRRDMNLTVL